MESIRELQEEVRKLKIENDNLLNYIKEYTTKEINNSSKIKEAEFIVSMLPKDSIGRNLFEEFSKSKNELNIEEYTKNSKLTKIMTLLPQFNIDQNNSIYFGNILVGNITDERFKEFLTKTIKVLPFLLKLYSRYLGFSEMYKNLDNMEYFGKEIYKKMDKL